MRKTKNKYKLEVVENSLLPFTMKEPIDSELISSLLSSYQAKLRKVLQDTKSKSR